MPFEHAPWRSGSEPLVHAHRNCAERIRALRNGAAANAFPLCAFDFAKLTNESLAPTNVPLSSANEPPTPANEPWTATGECSSRVRVRRCRSHRAAIVRALFVRAQVSDVHAEVCGPAYRNSVREVMGTTGRIPDEYWDGLAKLQATRRTSAPCKKQRAPRASHIARHHAPCTPLVPAERLFC
eukprot:5787394-Pleurochrysis_carterae.AAC.4